MSCESSVPCVQALVAAPLAPASAVPVHSTTSVSPMVVGAVTSCDGGSDACASGADESITTLPNSVATKGRVANPMTKFSVQPECHSLSAGCDFVKEDVVGAGARFRAAVRFGVGRSPMTLRIDYTQRYRQGSRSVRLLGRLAEDSHRMRAIRGCGRASPRLRASGTLV